MAAIRAILARNEHANRSSLVKAVCGTFGLLDSRGGPQISGCSKALRELERAGHFVLPASPAPTSMAPKVRAGWMPLCLHRWMFRSKPARFAHLS